MPRESIEDDRTMLFLAALTYRGFSSVSVGASHDAELRTVIAKGLGELEQLGGGRWQLVWGPESYRAVGSLFDDAMMFVAYEADNDRYVVAVRGTNPISSFDWLLGDLWVAEQVPWPYGDADGKRPAISLSTALGLHILQKLRSRPVAESSARVSDPKTLLAGALSRLDDLRQRVGRFVAPQRVRSLELTANEQIASLLERWQQRAGGDLLDTVSTLRAKLDRGAHRHLFSLLEDTVSLRSELDGGESLIEFLIGKPRGTQIAVTGHSKGGALAPALALWLAETLPASDVSCWAFAGPSPGNQDFADRFAEKLGKQFRPVVNPYDLVPHAWESATLKNLPTLYEGIADCKAPLSTLIGMLRDRMEEREESGQGYAHLSRDPIVFDPKPKTDEADYLAQVVHHHLDGYFIGAGMKLRVQDFFSPFVR